MKYVGHSTLNVGHFHRLLWQWETQKGCICQTKKSKLQHFHWQGQIKVVYRHFLQRSTYSMKSAFWQGKLRLHIDGSDLECALYVANV